MLKVLLLGRSARFERVLALCGLLVLAPAVAWADNTAFQRVIDDAVALFEAGRFDAARARFAEAHALSPSARTLRALGMVEFELHHYPESVSYLEQALSARVKPLDVTLRREAEDVLARARGETAQVTLAISPTGANVRVDGVTCAADQLLTLAPGTHVIEASAAGRKDERLELVLRAGEQRSLSLSLSPVLQADGTPAEARRERPLRANPWLWSGVGVTAAALITGLAVGLSGGDKRTARTYGGDTGAVLSAP